MTANLAPPQLLCELCNGLACMCSMTKLLGNLAMSVTESTHIYLLQQVPPLWQSMSTCRWVEITALPIQILEKLALLRIKFPPKKLCRHVFFAWLYLNWGLQLSEQIEDRLYPDALPRSPDDQDIIHLSCPLRVMIR